MRACSLLSSTRSLSPCASVVRVSRSWRDARPAHGSRRGERVMIVPPVPPPRAPNGVLRACRPGRRRLLSSETRCAVRADRVSRVHEDISPREREGGRLREKERERERVRQEEVARSASTSYVFPLLLSTLCTTGTGTRLKSCTRRASRDRSDLAAFYRSLHPCVRVSSAQRPASSRTSARARASERAHPTFC